eukprot:m.403347 g.403347  ORF g.403347 m.403347 type:complete len:74 (+) comp21191_c2_seq1:170-391(+)
MQYHVTMVERCVSIVHHVVLAPMGTGLWKFGDFSDVVTEYRRLTRTERHSAPTTRSKGWGDGALPLEEAETRH